MISNILLYAGSVVITLWGIAHIIPTKSVVNGFGSILEDNKRIIMRARAFSLPFDCAADGLSVSQGNFFPPK